MKKFYLLTKTLLVAALLMIGANAWAGEKTVVKYTFDDANSPSLTAGSRVSFDYTRTSVITSTKFLNAWNNANGDPGSSTISLGNVDLSKETWTLTFEWAACGGCNSKPDHTTLKAGETTLFDLSGNSNWNTTVTLSYGESGTATLPVPGCDKSKRFSAATGDQYNTVAYWHHFVITGSASGVKLTIKNSDSGESVVEDVVLSETNVNPTSLLIEPCCGGAIGIDELTLSYYVEGEVIQTPVASYTAVDGVNRTITATCETEGAVIKHSTDGENYEDGAAVTVSASGNVYFKAVKNASESDVLTFAAEAGTEIKLNAPVIVRTNNSVTISADQSSLLLSPKATITYEYGNEKSSFTGSKELTVAADATITAYAEAKGYATSDVSSRAVALFPANVEAIEDTPTQTAGWEANTFSDETKTVSERTYAALLLDGKQWGENVYLQTTGSWGLRATGSWYINSEKDASWILMSNMKAGDIVVLNIDYAACDMVNATYSEKYSVGSRHAYVVTADGDVEFAVKKINVSTMDYLYGIYAYRTLTSTSVNITAAGWATCCRSYPLDFTGSGLKAYIVTGATGNTLNLTQVTSVPANTAVLLEGAAGNYDVSVVASADAVEGNKLVGVTAKKEIAAEAGYVLMGSPSVGFYKNSKAFTVGANTAYLPANFAGGAAREAYFFDGLTGVNAVEAAPEAVAKEGKFIVDGKLRIFKKGQVFNAAGAQVK